MSRFYQIPVGATIRLVEPIKTDGIVTFRSSEVNLNPSTNNTQINLLASDSSILLHMGFRRVEDVIVFNLRTASSSWLTQQKVKFSGVFPGHNTTITVFDHGDRYQVLMNGQTKIYYDKELKGEATALGYIVNEGQSSIFSPTIAAQTYDNFAALVPGSA